MCKPSNHSCLSLALILVIIANAGGVKTAAGLSSENYRGHNKSKPSPYMPYLKKISEYSATEAEIKQVENAIIKDGFWEESFEWRISTVMTSRIEPKKEKDKKWFITTVKCEQEVLIPAATIERAVIFKKLYQDFQMELWHEQGWASWTKKDKS